MFSNKTAFTMLIASAFVSTSALAGHTNSLLEATLDGRQEVAADGSNKRIVGDPNGRGQAYVFGIDNDPFTRGYVLNVAKIQLVPVGSGIAAHIHQGKQGENGHANNRKHCCIHLGEYD